MTVASPKPARTRAGSFLKNTLLLGAVMVFCLGFVEVLVRTFVDDGHLYELEMWKYARDVKMRDEQPDLGHRHRPNAKADLMRAEVRTNGFGFRGPEIAEKAELGVARIAFVGDSTTFGWGVVEQETFAHQVIANLRKQGKKVDGFNLGVGNYNTTQELALFRKSGARMKPDIIVLTYFINDAEPIPTYPNINWLDLHSAAWIVASYRFDSVMRQFGSKPDWKKYYRDLYEPEAAGWKDTQKAMAGFAQIARELGVPLVVFHLPELRELKPYAFPDVTAKVKTVVEANGLRFVDLLPTVENMDAASLWVTVPDPHPNGKADTAFTGGILKEVLPMLQELCGKQAKGC